MTSIDISVTSLDGVWTFDGERIRSAHANVEPYAIDFLRRWTFARFLPGSILTLGFESDQPYSEYGSYGNRRGGVQVLRLRPDSSDWQLVAIEYEDRRFDEEFIPKDVVWHKRGILAWSIHDSMQIQHLASQRDDFGDPLLPQRDSDQPMEYRYEFIGDWKRLDISSSGHELTAVSNEGLEYFDLVGKRRSRDGSIWESWDDHGQAY